MPRPNYNTLPTAPSFLVPLPLLLTSLLLPSNPPSNNLIFVHSHSSSLTNPIVSLVTKAQAHIRGYLARRSFHKRLWNESYRKNIVKEIIKTESKYINDLKILINVFYTPLFNSSRSGKPIIPDQCLEAMFSPSLPVILNYNSIFLEMLLPKMEEWTCHSCVGEIFAKTVSLTFVDFFFSH